MAMLLLRAALALAAVAGLIYLVAWLLKKARASGMIKVSGPERRIRLIETARLGADSYLHLAEVDGKIALIGVGRGGISIVQWPRGSGQEGTGDMPDGDGGLSAALYGQTDEESTDSQDGGGSEGGVDAV